VKVESVTISNFKNYYGANPVELRVDSEDENIILIGGKNGFGKSTFCEAIRLCLFGKKIFGSPMSKKDYNEYLESSFNQEAKKEGEKKAFISMDVALAESFGNFNLSIKREWTIKNGSLKNEQLNLLRNNREFEYVPKEYWEDYLEKIFPPYLGKFFIFDGERVEEFATDPEFQDEIKNSLKDAIGLKGHETLYSDLSRLKSKIKRRNIEEEEIRKKIEEKNEMVKEKEKNLNEIETEIKDIDEQIDDLEEEKREKRSELDRVAGKGGEEIDQKNEKLHKLKTEKEEIRQAISDIAEKFLPFVLPENLSESLKDQLEHERRIKEKKSSKKFLERVNGEFSSKLKSRLEDEDGFDEKRINTIENSVKNTFEDFLDTEQNGNLIHDLTRKEIRKIQSFINQARKNVKNGFQEKIERLRSIDQEINDIETDLQTTKQGDNVRELINQISEIESEKGSLMERKETLKEKKKEIEDEIDEISSDIKKLENDIICAEVDRRKVEKIQNVQNVIEEVEKDVITSRINKLEEYISERYHKLSNKDDMVKKIVVDEDNFNVKLFDSDDNILDKESISTGEKEIFAISVLEGLIKISDYDFPVIIDAPLTSLDEEHTDNILSQFVPNISDQVVLLSTDREIDENKYQKIKDRINKEFAIEKEGPNKIKEGYFFDQ